MAICELDSEHSLCREAKQRILKVHMDNISGFEEHAEFDLVVDVSEARRLFGDEWEAFLKRNRLDGETDMIYLEKVRREHDLAKLKPVARRLYTGWIDLDGMPDDRAAKLLKGDHGDVLTSWDMIGFDEMNETCARCELSWDKGRGCIGTFGPDNSLLPEIAERYGCKIVAGAYDAASSGRVFSPDEAAELLQEVSLLRERLPEEGKMVVRRYSGVLDRLEEMARTCARFRTRFYFI